MNRWIEVEDLGEFRGCRAAVRLAAKESRRGGRIAKRAKPKKEESDVRRAANQPGR